MLMMCPYAPRACMSCTTARVHMAVPSTFVLSISTQLATLPSNMPASLRDMPALLTSTSTPQPCHRFATILGSVATSTSLVTSHTTGRKFEGGTPITWCMCCCSSSRRSLRLATATTRMPHAASASHTARPMPLDDPVTRATRSTQRSMPVGESMANDEGCSCASSIGVVNGAAGSGSVAAASGATDACADTGTGIASCILGCSAECVICISSARSGSGASSMITLSGTWPGSGPRPSAARAAICLSFSVAASRSSLMMR
mmetsp:Transcript_17195/g.51651  ORF Transcript_17195/g.51651 Transcript_17195/m.51651 type:complete len:260 (+) Transcript_17195:560-1339(+)